jgi:hypothetical protein
MFATTALSCSRNSFWQPSARLLLRGTAAVSLCAGTALADNSSGNGNGNGEGAAVRLLTTMPVPGAARRSEFSMRLTFGNGNLPRDQPTNLLFFAAGPHDEKDGLCGRIEASGTGGRIASDDD